MPDRRRFLKSVGAGAAALAAASRSREAEAAEARPNLLFVFPDQFRQQAMGFMEADPVVTPNLDRLAGDGLVFTNAVSNRPVCSPYRAQLMTGKYPCSNGVTTNCNSASARHGIELRESERCISDVLHDAGYSLGYIGKWHLDAPREPYVEPPRKGDGNVWDEFTPPGPRRHGFDFWHSYGCYDGHMRPHYWGSNAKRDGRIVVDRWSPEHEAGVAISYIENRDGRKREARKPFALFVAMNPPHPPFSMFPPRYSSAYDGKSDRDLLVRPNVRLEGRGRTAARHAKNYFSMVTGVDEQFGRILACLRKQGLEKDTIVVFTSDHGELMGSHGCIGKTLWYEESFTIPFILRWPGKVRPGRDALHLGTPDVMPSLLGLMGLAKRIPREVEGADYSAVMLGSKVERPRSSFYLTTSPTAPTLGRRGVRTDRYTFVVQRSRPPRSGGDGERLILHDNEKDPYQMKNVADANPTLVAELRRELRSWLQKTNDPWLGT